MHRYKQRYNSFEVGDEVLAHLRKEHYPTGTYSKLKVKNIGACWIKKFGENAYCVQLIDEVDISLIFNVLYLYKYDTLEEEYLVEDGKFDWDNDMPKKKDEEIDEVLD